MTRSGLTLDDRYRLDERIAAGGVGQVWQATDLLLERAVAVKVLRPEYSGHPDALDRFRKEARHAGAISNAHVAQVYDYRPAGPGSSPYLVLEYVDGPSLADILAVGPVEPARALDIIAQAADGLSAAHRARLVHRDVKPGNILIRKDGQVKVTDFGIAHAAGQAPVTGPGLVMGTTQYLAPERIAGGQGTAASDVYALGIVLHECLTGVPPHDGTPAEVMAAHLYLPLPPLPAGTPPELDELVARLTVKDPDQRISDARELADLAALLRDSLSGVPHPATARTTPGAVAAGSVPQAGVLAAGPLSAPDDGHGPAGPSGPPGYLSDEWKVPARMSQPTRPSQAGRPLPQRRRKTGAIALGSAVVAGAGLVALLLSGALSEAPAANRHPAGSPATVSPARRLVPPRASPSGSARGSRPPGAVTGPGGPAAPGTPGQATKPAMKPSPGSSPAPGGSPSAAPGGTAPGGAPSAPAPATPGGTPGSAPGGTSPASSPTQSGCLLGLCL